MTKCIVLVELEDADQAAYGELHRMLLNAGLGGTIKAESGAEYKLPAGSYSYDGQLDSKGLRDTLKIVVGSLGRPYGVLVTEGTSVWSLTLVKEGPPDKEAQPG